MLRPSVRSRSRTHTTANRVPPTDMTGTEGHGKAGSLALRCTSYFCTTSSSTRILTRTGSSGIYQPGMLTDVSTAITEYTVESNAAYHVRPSCNALQRDVNLRSSRSNWGLRPRKPCNAVNFPPGVTRNVQVPHLLRQWPDLFRPDMLLRKVEPGAKTSRSGM
jgi:hypothetical protein